MQKGRLLLYCDSRASKIRSSVLNVNPKRRLLQRKTNNIDFDILVRNEAPGETPNVHNIDKFRSDPEEIETCRRWLHRQGVSCHATEFGLACIAPCDLFESLFSTKVLCSKQSGKTTKQLSTNPTPPDEIAVYIASVTLTVAPDLF